MSTTLTRDAILGVADLKTESIEVPEWGGLVTVRSLTGAERDAFEMSLLDRGNGKDGRANLANLRARLVVLTVVDAGGARLFSDDDAAAVGRKSAAALDRIFSVAQRLNGLSRRDVEDLAGNSVPGQSAVSISA